MNNIRMRVHKIIAEKLGISQSEIELNFFSSIHDFGEFEAIELKEIALAIEAEFDVCIPEEMLEKNQFINTLVEYIHARNGCKIVYTCNSEDDMEVHCDPKENTILDSWKKYCDNYRCIRENRELHEQLATGAIDRTELETDDFAESDDPDVYDILKAVEEELNIRLDFDKEWNSLRYLIEFLVYYDDSPYAPKKVDWAGTLELQLRNECRKYLKEVPVRLKKQMDEIYELVISDGVYKKGLGMIDLKILQLKMKRRLRLIRRKLRMVMKE